MHSPGQKYLTGLRQSLSICKPKARQHIDVSAQERRISIANALEQRFFVALTHRYKK